MQGKRLAIAIAAIAGVSLSAFAADTAAKSQQAQPERKVFAHFMGCFPAGYGSMSWHWSHTFEYLKGEGYLDQLGGNFANWPLVPHAPGTPQMTLEDAARLDISRAQRAGFDGFAFDAWAGDNSREILDAYFKVAEEMGTGFQLTICFDASCHWASEGRTMADAYVESANYVLRHKDSPCLARFDGKPLFFGYYSKSIAPAVPGETLEQHFAAEKKGWDEFREKLGVPVFLHGSLDDVSGDWEMIGKTAANIYDAVGSFLGGGGADTLGGKKTADAVKAAGAVWSQPMSYQYANKSGWAMSWGGLDMMRICWEAAIANDSRLIQFVTWNDYGEESGVAPTTGNAYTTIRMNKYFSDMWRNGGVPPAIEKDEIHLIYRRTVGNPSPWPLYSRRLDCGSYLHVLTLLKEPATITVEGYGTYEAPAGFHRQDFEMKVGYVSATAKRGDKTVCSVKAPEPISDRRWREDNTLVAFGTGYDDEWRLDFPDIEPEYYSENGDIDGDGMPNWYEMLFFGRFPDMSTAGAGAPDEDPDDDFATNLEEYENYTDPTKPDEPYRIGFTWDSRQLTQQPYAWNPMRDTKNHIAWHSLIERASEGKPIAFEGNWAPAPLMLQNAKNRVINDWNWATTIKYSANGAVELNNRTDSAMMLGWEAPLTGDFEVSADFHPGYGDGALKAILLCKTKEGVKRLDESVVHYEDKGFFATRKVSLAKGDMLVIASDASESRGVNPLVIDSFTIKLVGGEGIQEASSSDSDTGLPELF